jgi:hypothetical protein
MRPLWSTSLGVSSLLLIVLETLRATNAIAHAPEIGGVSFIGMALSGSLVSVGGPIAATVGLAGVGLSWQRRRVGHAIVLVFALAFLVTHVLDQTRTPGPPVADIARISGVLGAWVTMLWAWAAVIVIALSTYALITDRSPLTHRREQV